MGLKNVLLMGVLTLAGLAAGFVLGMHWTTARALSLNENNISETLKAARKELTEQQNNLRSAQWQIAELTQQIMATRNRETASVTIQQQRGTPTPVRYYSGDELMQAVNKYRREHGVPELILHSGLCQVASFRLGELLVLGRLDNHAGFEKYFNEHKISEMSGERLTNVAENLASGYPTAAEAVAGWDKSPPHRTFLLADGAYKYGCAAANQNIAVLLGGF